MKRILLIACALGSMWPALSQTPAAAPADAAENPRLAAFNELLARAQRASDGLSADDVVKLLNEGRDLGCPHPVAGVVRSFLSRNPDPTPRVLRLAAQNAMLAGDFRLAASRYKQFFRNAPANADSSEAAAELFRALTDYTKQVDDAFAANADYGDKYRQSAQVKQFDGWFLERCWERRATGAMAKRLASIFSEKLPLEQERFAYWHHVDRLIERLASVYPGNAEAILSGRTIIPLIREDPIRAARLGFFIENIAFHETRAGKDPAVLAREFEPVLAAARAYLESDPREQTLRHIMAAFGGGPERPDDAVWNTLPAKKQEFFTAVGFSKLPEADQIKFLNGDWPGLPVSRLATADQWVALGGKHPQAFQKASGIARLPWITQTTNAPLYKAQSQFLAASAFPGAAVINAMAAANDVNGSIQHLLSQAAWYTPFNDRGRNNVEALPDLVFNQIIPAWAYLKIPAGGAEREAFIYEAQLAFMDGALFNSVMTPFSPNHVRHALRNVWGYCSQDAARRDRYMALLGKLSWVPFVGEKRDKVFEPALNEFRRWAQETRRDFDKLAGKTDEASVKSRTALEAVVAQIAKLEAAFKLAVESDPDPAQAPNPQCREVAALIKAVWSGDAAAYAAAAKPIYAAIREYQKNKAPFGEALLELLMTPRDEKLECFGQQMEILADQLTLRLATPTHTRGAQACIRQLASRNGWRWDSWTIRARNEDNAMRDALADTLAKAIEARTAKDVWDGELFNWYRGVVRQEGEQAKALVSALVERDIFTKQNVSMWHPGPTCSYLALIRNEFSSLRDKYPAETWFDDRMVAEIKRTGKVDDAYWNYGHDRLKKVANAVAELFTADTSYNFVGTPAAPAKYTRDQYWAISWRVLNADGPLISAYMSKIQAEYGKTRFDGTAAGTTSIGWMLADSPEKRKAFFDRLREYTTRAKEMPYYLGLPPLPQLTGLPLTGTAPLTDEELLTLADCFRYTRWTGWTGTEELLMQRLNDGLSARGRFGELLPLIPEMWRIAYEQNRRETMLMIAGFTAKLMEDDQSIAASTYSVTGLEIASSRLPEDIRNSLTAMRTKSQAQAGGGLLVDRSDRRYPILAAQALFHAGRLDSAWEHYLQAPQLALSEFKDLDLGFTIWIVERRTTLGQFDQADELARTLIQWIDAAPQGFDPETRAQMLIAYADIAFVRQEYPRARAQYDRVAVAREFAGTYGSKRAELKIAEVDRLTRHFDAAFERLDKLDRQRDVTIQAEARYQMALLKFDQEDYAGARDAINRVFAVAPNHAQAGLLEGELNVRTKKLVEATELKIGLSADQQTLIPGRALRVGLEDRTLAVVGKTTDVEIRVWTDSGDEEHFMLLPFGDSKTKFRGEIATALAPTKKGDRLLQVLGRDKVHYGFSDRFRKAAGVSAAETVTVEVITDAELYASSGRILTREEQEERALEQMIRQREKIEEERTAPLSTLRSADEIKPGNPVYIRMIDPDRSATPQKDTATVRVMASSGDVVDLFVLEETETHSGVFEGRLPTATASATAFASDTEEGRQPNFVIAGDMNLPPWVALGDKNRHKRFTIDLNNNITLGKLSLLADVTGRTLKRFAVQTSMNGTEYTTVAAWPATVPAWDGSLRLRMVRYSPRAGAPGSLKEFKEYFDYGFLVNNDPIETGKGKMADDLRQAIRAVEQKIGLRGDNAPGSWALAHLQGTFYVPERRKRTFKLDPKNRTQNVKYILAVNGVEGSSPHELTVSLAKGYHTIDLYAAVQSQTQAAYELLWDIAEEPYTARVPEAVFTAAEWLPEALPSGFKPAELKPNEAGTQFELVFSPGTTARLVRFGLFDFESDAPAIRKVGLTDAADKKILPAADDVLALRKNQILEIVPGDRVTVAYADPSSINRERQNIEVFLSATFYNAQIGAYFVETMVDPHDNMRKPLFVPMRRYRADEPVTVFIQDPDADETEEKDQITFYAQTTAGKKIQLPAVETDKHSGMFVSRLFPVLTEPKRPTELTVTSGDDILIGYQDEKNTDYGIPWERTFTVEQAGAATPELRVFEYESRLLTSNELVAIAARMPTVATGEVVPMTRTLNAVRPAALRAEKAPSSLLGGPLIVEMRNAALAISPLSDAELVVQTSAARKLAGVGEDAPFDPSLPGTVRYRMGITELRAPKPPEGYDKITLVGDPFAMDPLDDGRFTFVIPTTLGSIANMDTSTTVTPQQSRSDDDNITTIGIACLNDKGEPRTITQSYKIPPLHLRPDDVIRIAVNTAAPKEAPQWTVLDVNLTSDVAFDVMDQRYQKNIDALHVGERLYLRIIDPMADLTIEKDKISLSLLVNNAPETAKAVELMETFENTGVFKGSVQLVYEGVKNENPMPDTIAVPYGAAITLKYSSPHGLAAERQVAIRKGADGEVLPFTKRFQDTEIAVQTQFTMAEAYFEMAKKHRALKEEEVARRGIAQGKKLLEEAIRDYPKTDARVQADYLLANLAFESAEQTENEELRKKLFVESVTRFSDLIAGYPDSEYAPKSQFKKALVFERMGEIDAACEEYVKLSYRYPENELVAETIARLGQYFMTKGKEIEDRLGGETDLVQKEKIRMQANEFYRTAAQVFARLSDRFPEHTLAAKTKVLSAENWLRGQELQKAVNVYESIIAEKKAQPELIAQSMYWCGDSYIRMKNYTSAYRMLKRLTWDYPESVWAKYARGRLTEPELAKVELSEMKE